MKGIESEVARRQYEELMFIDDGETVTIKGPSGSAKAPSKRLRPNQ